MNAGCVFLCFLLLMQVCPSQFSGSALLRPDVVNIGALFPFDSTVGRVARMAIGEAVKDVNADPNILVGTRLVLKMQNSNCSPFIAMASAMQFMEDDVVAIIGPQSSVVAHVISYVVKEHQVPLLSFAATDPSLSPLQFPFFVRTVPSDRYPMAAIADMVSYYGWREVIAIYVDDDFGRNGVAALDDVLGEKRCRISYKMGIAPSPGAAGQDSMNDILIKIAVLESRVIILHLNPDSGLKLLSAASHLGMIGNGYVWIATDWLSSLLDSPPPPSHGMAARSMEGVLSLRLHIPDSTAKRAFVSRWKKVTGGGGSLGLNAYGLYAYDTVWLLGRAMDAFLKKNGTISFSTDTKVRSLHTGSLHLEATNVFDQGRDVLQNILRTEFTGLTGQVAFDADRSRVSPCFDIINVVGGGYRRVGYWSNGSGLSTVRPDGRLANRVERLGSVIWPGGTGATPRGWVFPNNGKRLRIGVPRRVSFKEFVSEARGTETFKGFCIDVFSAAVSLLPYAVPYQFIPYGDDRRNPSYSELVNLINAGVFDAAVGDISIVMNRTKYVDFTQPYIASGLVVVAPFKQMNSGAWAFLRPFSPLMWCITAGFFLVIGLVVWILEHRINDDFRGPPRKQFVTILCFSFSTLFFAHRENMMSALGRLVLIVWLFVVLIINSSYTASLTSLLTVQQLFSPFESIESLKESGERVGFQVGSFTEYYLEEIGIPRSKLVALGSPEEYAAALLRGSGNGGVAAVVDELPYADIFLSNQCNFKVVGREFTRSGWGFAFPRDSPLAADLSTAILSLSEEGDLQRIHDKWLVKNACSMDGAEIRSDRLHLTSFEGLFVICALSCLAALVVHFSHIIFQFRRAAVPTSTSRSGSTASSHSKSLKRFLSMMDEKEEDFKSRGKEHDDHCRDDDDERKPKRRHKI